jgi:hypothetical protein
MLGFNIFISQHSKNVGRNYEIGITKLCPNKSFILILKVNERLADTDSLLNLREAVQPRHVLGIFATLNVSGELKISGSEFQDYTKITHNGANPRYDDLNQILNHLRIFHSDCYKIIPQFELRTPENEYF